METKLSHKVNNAEAETKLINKTKMDKCTPIQEFYKNQSVFITGGTGFLGKVLIEKLLRSCPDISSIFILVRPKKGKNIKERMQDLLSDIVFNRLRQEEPNFYTKMIPIPGDSSLPNLGLSSQDVTLLTKEVSIVFHVAASVNFNEALTQASATNIQSTASVIELCKKMQKLKSLIHVSTVYTNVFDPLIEEKFCNYPVTSEEFFQLMKVSSFENNEKLTKIMKLWPNTYVFTKALAEDLIRRKSDNLPIGIFRPGIVISTANEPISGYIDNHYGPSGGIIAIAKGLIRITHCDRDSNCNVIPADFTINALIASAWDVAVHVDRRGERMLIYNFVSAVESLLSWGTFQNHTLQNMNKYPLNDTFWYPVFIMTNNRFLYRWGILFLHYLPAIFVDCFLIVSGRKLRLLTLYQKLHRILSFTYYFCTNEWTFKNDNVQNMWNRLKFEDKKMFKFSMRNFDWPTYLDNYVIGLRTHLVKDDPKTLESSRLKNRMFYFLHQVITKLIIFLGCWLLWNIFF